MKKFIIILVVAAVVGVGIWAIISIPKQNASQPPQTPQNTQTQQNNNQNNATPTQPVQNSAQEVIGKSVQGRDITVYNFGTGSTQILFVAGSHGGYAWNSSLLAYQVMDYLSANPSAIPSNVKVTVIPDLNPDGTYKVTGTSGRFTQADVTTSQSTLTAGRFNADMVDLNRNFDCNWNATSTWQTTVVSAGSAPFSEPESQALENYVLQNKPAAVIVFDSAAGGVFSSSCGGGILAATKTLNSIYSNASGYASYDTFSFYPLTGDMTDWMASQNIPAVTVMLSNHQDTELNKNLDGINAVLQHYAG